MKLSCTSPATMCTETRIYDSYKMALFLAIRLGPSFRLSSLGGVPP